MSSIQKRLENLEAKAKPQAGGWLVVTQDDDDPGIFADSDGNQYTRQEIEALEPDYEMVILVQYHNRPTGESK